MTFYEWYEQHIVARLYSDQAAYERESVAYTEIDKLSQEQIFQLFGTMTVGELRLALFDHVKSCIAEQWHPDAEPTEFRED